ncbi:hypothetical protein CCMA1212_002528 [Trichoderma ghanense]|uniref:Uncharacterized protein n=1 Tax=Trichoderma ghanense TaxID=65468 RepID=A0ABY2HAS0_9HYPO
MLEGSCSFKLRVGENESAGGGRCRDGDPQSRVRSAKYEVSISDSAFSMAFQRWKARHCAREMGKSPRFADFDLDEDQGADDRPTQASRVSTGVAMKRGRWQTLRSSLSTAAFWRWNPGAGDSSRLARRDNCRFFSASATCIKQTEHESLGCFSLFSVYRANPAVLNAEHDTVSQRSQMLETTAMPELLLFDSARHTLKQKDVVFNLHRPASLRCLVKKGPAGHDAAPGGSPRMA